MDTDGGSNIMPPPVPGIDVSGVVPPNERTFYRHESRVAMDALDGLKRLVERADDDVADVREAMRRLDAVEISVAALERIEDKTEAIEDLDGRLSDIENEDYVTKDGVEDAVADYLSSNLSDAVNDAISDSDIVDDTKLNDAISDALDDYVEKSDLPDFDEYEARFNELDSKLTELRQISGVKLAVEIEARLEVLERGFEQIRPHVEALAALGLTEIDIKRLKALSNLLGQLGGM